MRRLVHLLARPCRCSLRSETRILHGRSLRRSTAPQGPAPGCRCTRPSSRTAPKSQPPGNHTAWESCTGPHPSLRRFTRTWQPAALGAPRVTLPPPGEDPPFLSLPPSPKQTPGPCRPFLRKLQRRVPGMVDVSGCSRTQPTSTGRRFNHASSRCRAAERNRAKRPPSGRSCRVISTTQTKSRQWWDGPARLDAAAGATRPSTQGWPRKMGAKMGFRPRRPAPSHWRRPPTCQTAWRASP